MRTLILLVCLSLGLPINAMVVEVVGSAPMNGAMSYVREQAMQDAMQQAVLRAGMQISSTQLMSKGVIEQDEVRIQGKGQLRSEEHTSELQSRPHLVCRLLLEKKK